jgi:hypothetical protein
MLIAEILVLAALGTLFGCVLGAHVRLRAARLVLAGHFAAPLVCLVLIWTIRNIGLWLIFLPVALAGAVSCVLVTVIALARGWLNRPARAAAIAVSCLYIGLLALAYRLVIR